MLMSHLPGTIEYWASSSLYQIKIRRVFLLVIFVWKRKMSSSSFMKTRDSNVKVCRIIKDLCLKKRQKTRVSSMMYPFNNTSMNWEMKRIYISFQYILVK
ncbi:uncharacterized protein LOC143231826 isoform X3 [Tachypleus tridentatus]|uniref:uncharacterized protein LOC143231826 isoform X3 n=1 Tax=Tachypleus tridentatus TaxID=6853 RepID=UPI003FD07E4D